MFGNAKAILAILALSRCGFLDFFFQCVGLLRCESGFGDSRVWSLCFLCFFFYFILQLSRSLVCVVCLFISTITFLFLMFVQFSWWVSLSELSSQFQVVSRSTGLTAISLPESLPFPGEALWGIAWRCWDTGR